MGNANEGSSMTQIDAARAGTITREMAIVAEKEGRDPEFIREGVAAGRIAIPANIHHTSLSPEGVGGGLRTKVNVNLGISGDVADEAEEWKKVDVALELGADVLVQFAGPCRLGYYGELQQSILRDLGYEFDMLNFAMLTGKPLTEYISVCKKKVNPDLSVPHGVRNMLAVFKMIEHLDEVNDFYLANAGFEAEPGSFERAREAYFADMRAATNEREIAEAQRKVLDALRALPQHRPARPLRVGIVGEYFTAADPASNLDLERKFLDMGVELHRALNMTNRNLRYNEKNLRAGISEYVQYDMGPTSSMTIAAARKYAQEGFDGIVHLKSSGCTPEVDCMPVLQRISRDTGVPVLYLSYDSQTSDTGLDTRLEAFYDMIAMKKEKTR